MSSENQQIFYRLIRGVNIATDTNLHINYWPLNREKDVLTDKEKLDPNQNLSLLPLFKLLHFIFQRLTIIGFYLSVSIKEPLEGEYVYFLRSIGQVLLTRYRRESVLQERVELAVLDYNENKD